MFNTIFAAGIICFALTMVGVLLTVYEFRKLGHANSARLTPAKVKLASPLASRGKR
jgi:cbb3-type cytochrome oxidase subunit 3